MAAPAPAQVAPPPTTNLAPRPSGSLIGRALDYIADKANIIPGFRMFTIILGVNPINLSPVDRSAANIIRAIVEFLPGGALITAALDNHGIIERVGAWVDAQLRALGISARMIQDALYTFLDSLSWTDIFDPVGVWDRAVHIFSDPINRIISFVKSLVIQILQFIRQAILLPLARLAEGTRGYDLLKAVLGEDPITGQPVPRNAETLVGGFMKLIGKEELWNNIRKANAVARVWAWFKGALNELVGFVRQIPTLFMAALRSLEIMDLVLVPRAFAKLVGVFGNFVVRFITWAGNTVWNLLQIVFEVVAPGAIPYIKKTAGAFRAILSNPIGFVGNLVKAAKLGFQKFADNIGTHLKNGLISWLTGSLTGVYIPKELSLLEIGKFALSVLGITWAQIRGKIVKALGPNGEKIMTVLESTFDIVVALVKGGPAAAWEVIKEKLTNLKDMVIDGIMGFVIDAIVKKAVPKLISMFIPGAGFISAIISIYDTIMVFVEKISQIIQVVTAFIDSIVAIAGGALEAATKRVERILGGLLSLAISFLAGFLGLGKVTDKIMGVVEKVRLTVDKALDTAINWIVTKAKALFAKLFGKKDKPDDRTEEQKKADLVSAVTQATSILADSKNSPNKVKKKLPEIKNKYRLTSLEIVRGAETPTSEKDHIHAAINPDLDGSEIEKPKDGGVLSVRGVRVTQKTQEKIQAAQYDWKRYEELALSNVLKEDIIPDIEERTGTPVTTNEPGRESAQYLTRLKIQKAMVSGSRRPKPEARAEVLEPGGRGAISHVFAVEVTTVRDLTDFKGEAVRHKLDQVPNTIQTLIEKYGSGPEIEYTIIAPRDIKEDESKIIEGLLNRPDAKNLKVVWIRTDKLEE